MHNQLPEFPEFEQLGIHHKKLLRDIAASFPCYSDYNFVSLFTWDAGGEIAVSTLNDNLIIRFSDYTDGSAFYSLLGDNQLRDTMRQLIEDAEKRGIRTDLSLIPHSVIEKLNLENEANELTIEEDLDNHDYIYLVDDLVELSRSSFQTKRNLLNRFNRNFSARAQYEELELGEPAVQKQINDLLEKWQFSRGKTDEQVATEFSAIRRFVKHHEELEIQAFGVYVDGQLSAFTFFELLPNKMAIIHFDKSDTSIEGIVEYLKHNTAKQLRTFGVDKYNYEQDLGIEGLRRAKMSYHPTEFLKKYKVTKTAN